MIGPDAILTLVTLGVRDLARSIATDLAAVGSPLALADLAGHKAELREPVMLLHSLGRLYNMAPPTQGTISLMILGILDQLELGKVAADSADHVHLAVEATKQAFLSRDRHITDPAYMTVDAYQLLDRATLALQVAAIKRDQALPWGAQSNRGDTVWMGAIDGAGRAVSMIQSIYHEFGSGVVLKGSHINWQNRGCSFALDERALNTLKPRRKPFHTLNPALAQLDDGRTIGRLGALDAVGQQTHGQHVVGQQAVGLARGEAQPHRASVISNSSRNSRMQCATPRAPAVASACT